MGGKLGGQAAAAVAAQLGPPGRPGRLGLLVDDASKRAYLIDTGAVYSVIPFTSSDPPTGPALTTADGTPLPCWGACSVTIRVGSFTFTWNFLRAAVAFPLIGGDFLVFFKLMVDLSRLRLVARSGRIFKLVAPPVDSNVATLGVRPAASCSTSSALHIRLSDFGSASSALHPRLSVSGSPASALPQQLPMLDSPVENLGAGVILATVPQDYAALLADFPEVVNPSKLLPVPTHGVLHHIETTGRPVAAKYRRLDSGRLKAAQAEFRDLERQGIVRRSSSNWSSPLHMVKKADGSWRPCGDYRLLNLQTTPDRYTCPNIGDLTSRLRGCTVFSKLDLRKGYHQVPVRPEDVPKTAVITPFGLFEYVRMPFGLRNAGQTFQRMMDSILQGLDYCFVYLDDVLVASSDHEQHEAHLREVLRRFSEHGLVLNAEKCDWGKEELDYLGHHVSARGIAPIRSRVQAIIDFPKPVTVAHLQTYLGMVNFYRRFLHNAARVLKPLTDSLRGCPKGAVSWSGDMEAAFVSSKAALQRAGELAHPDSAAELSLAVDASDTHIGAVLQQRTPQRGLEPLAFFSAKLDAAQCKYSAFDRELCAIFFAIRHFRWQLEGRIFHVLSDHKPLSFALHRLTDAWSARQQRQLSYVAEFTSDIRHVPGKSNVVADALSRPAAAVAPCSSVPVDFAELARAQPLCPETVQLRASSTLQIQDVLVAGQLLWCDVSTGTLRPLVPVNLRQMVFETIHNLAHPGVRATRRLLVSRFTWRGCAADVARWCKDCQHCARGKVTVQEKTAIQPIPVPSVRFSHVHVDIVGPLPVSACGVSHLLTVIDRTTRWPEVIPLRSTTAAACADAFTAGWVARFGVPLCITTDRGAQFTSATWSCLCKSLGIRLIHTTAFHPQSNGMVERFHRQLKEALRARNCGAAWLEHLPWALLGLRAAPKEQCGISSAEAVYGSPLVLPGQVQDPDPPVLLLQDVPLPTPPVVTSTPRSYADVARGAILDSAEYVYVRRGPSAPPFAPAYAGPYQVLGHTGKVYKLQVGARVERVSADRLKPHVGSPPVVAQPPRRGRPPGTGD